MILCCSSCFLPSSFFHILCSIVCIHSLLYFFTARVSRHNSFTNIISFATIRVPRLSDICCFTTGPHPSIPRTCFTHRVPYCEAYVCRCTSGPHPSLPRRCLLIAFRTARHTFAVVLLVHIRRFQGGLPIAFRTARHTFAVELLVHIRRFQGDVYSSRSVLRGIRLLLYF